MGEFYSVAVTNHHQQADTGTKMIHIGANTRSTIVSKDFSRPVQQQLSWPGKDCLTARNARNYSQCDSMLIGSQCGAHTFPYIQVQNDSAQVEHEASTSKIGEDQLFYFAQRGIGAEEAVSMIINGFARRFSAAAFGIRGGSHQIAQLQAGRKCRMINANSKVLLEVRDLHATVGGAEILKG